MLDLDQVAAGDEAGGDACVRSRSAVEVLGDKSRRVVRAEEPQPTRVPDEKLNPQGGAIALGHLLVSSRSRILASMLGHLERTGGKYGIAAQCIGVGQGAALLVERV